MKNKYSSRKTWLLLISVLTLFILISYFTFSPKPQSFPRYVTDSPSPTGVKAIYTYLNKETDVAIWGKPPEMLPHTTKNKLLIMIEPSIQLTKEDMQKYVSFIENGNTILLLKDDPKGMFDVKTVSTKDTASNTIFDSENRVVKSLVKSSHRLRTSDQDKILLYDHLGPIALKRTLGKGQLIVGVTPEWMTNQNILKLDNLSQILLLINEGNSNAILLDEYIHGQWNDTGFLSAFPKWLLLIFLQGALVIILWLWLKGKRFGPIFMTREETVRFSDEGIRALTAWYLKGRRYHDSIIIQADYVKLLLQERWGIPYSRQWQDLPNYLERKWQQIPTSEILPFINGLAHVLEKERISKQEYLLWSKKLDQLRKEVEAG
ncbi:DUF4350 domain-containing protein [Paenibacillus sp. BSR1-1]|uniref:DUF4350 domain-containing protein n=1 Tax=Paenibacillus sp. BSR1-1 TaxID=3020845 RepID=UPI0025AF2D9E|nr:DUF4350 domain-containing protein [Paenibacillus sp. BSR1-1]MDN3016252.1 DUF4350 domain-containing protein [Paenibacillus sp. BSR1-1]